MNKKQIEEIIDQINKIVQTQMWMDFEINQFNGQDLIIGGSIDLSDTNYFMTICFSDIDFISLKTTWKTNTAKSILTMAGERDIWELKSRVPINPECNLFKLISEDSSFMFISAKIISFEMNNHALTAPNNT